MLSLLELAALIRPERTVLFLGAGASVPSGAPSGAELAKFLEKTLAGGEEISEDLMELATILENRYGRGPLVEAVRTRLSKLRPTGGLLVLPEYEWPAIYTTNFDTLVESSYDTCRRRVIPIRSNYDYGKMEGADGVPLLKLHGCIKSDVIDGHKARLVLTERDYDSYEQYRQTLYDRLKLDVNSKDVLIVGYALKDAHLRAEIKTAGKLHKDADTPGRIFALVYHEDKDRAKLLEDQGIQVAFGGIDQLMDTLVATRTPEISIGAVEATEVELPVALKTATIDIREAASRNANYVNLFNGYPASYADIAHGYTFERTKENIIALKLNDGAICASIIGVAGVGKTSLARRILSNYAEKGWLAWEHKSELPLKAEHWLTVESKLRSSQGTGILLIDDSPFFQRQVNMLVDGLAKVDDPALKLLLVGERSQWLPRTKSPRLFSNGYVEEVSQLEEVELQRLLNLIDLKPEIRGLIDIAFTNMSKSSQLHTLQRKCSADMYVSLKHIFAFEGLDSIILKEYSRLPENLQDIYRTVAALESAGTRVHRQMIIRLLAVNLDYLKGSLAVLEGLVDEYDIKPEDGLYGWRTRHEVIAQTLTRFKYAEEEEIFALLKEVARNINPTLYIERRTLNDLCNSDYGIRRLVSPERRLELYQDLIQKAPGERVPRHRLIYEYLQLEDISGAEQAIRDAEQSVKLDGPIARYKVVLTLLRARKTEGIALGDRRALLLEAYRLAVKGNQLFPEDKYLYMVFEPVGYAFYDITGEVAKLEEGLETMRKGAERLLDPHLAAKVLTLERELIPLRSKKGT